MTRQKTLQTCPSLCRPEPIWRPPSLRFSPTAWAKLLYLRDLGDTEVGGFGIMTADDLLLIDDVQLVRQACTGASVAFDDLAVANFFDEQVDQGRKPEQFGRIWVHTHPGNSPEPSQVDEETFCRVFGRTDWALMFVLARGGASYARLRFHVGPGGEMDIPVAVDYSRPFAGSDHAAWKEQYAACVETALDRFDLASPGVGLLEPWEEDAWLSEWDAIFGSDRRADIEDREDCHAI
jgi:hypothetical protein